MSQHFLHRTGRLFDKSREVGHPASPPPVPLDETRLAQEIARIIEKRPARPAATTKPAAAQWLGEEDDRAFVERYAATASATGAEATATVENQANSSFEGDHDEPKSTTAMAQRSAAMPADWVKKARRQRLRSRLRDVAGWTISITVSLALVIAVSVAMFGWPNGGAILKQLQVKSIDVSAIEEDRQSTLRRDQGR